jgi:hypothetical protein
MIPSILLIAASALGAANVPTPTGTPWPMHTVDNTSEGADGARLADVNGDGLLDIATGWEEGNSIRVYLNPGTDRVQVPWPKVIVGDVGAPEDAVLADMDGDGAIDVVSCSEGGAQQVWFHWAPTDAKKILDAASWETVALPVAAKRAKWMFSLPCDVNGDGQLDLVAGAKNDGAAIGWFESPEDPRDVAAWQWHPMRDAGWIMSLVLHDMNSDGNMDIVYTDRRGARTGMGWLEHPGNNSGTDLTGPWLDHVMGGTEYEVMFVGRGSNGAGATTSWWCAAKAGGIIRIDRSEGDRWQQQVLAMPAGTGGGKGIALGDLNLDGHEDVALTCENAEGKHGVLWLDGNPTQNWAPNTIAGLVGTKFDLVRLHDFDGDGDLDLLTCEEREGLGVVWYENPVK